MTNGEVRQAVDELGSLCSALASRLVTLEYAAEELRALANRLDPQTTLGPEEVQPEGGEA